MAMLDLKIRQVFPVEGPFHNQGLRSNKELLLSAKASRPPLVTPLVCEACGCGSRIPGR